MFFLTNRILSRIIFFGLFFLLVSGCGRIKKDPKYTAAIVNGKAITRVAFDKEMERVKQRFQNKSPQNDKQLDNIRMEILDILIGGELLYQASVEKKITIPKNEVEKELKKINDLYPETETFKNTFTEEDVTRKLAIEKFITVEFADTTVITDEESRDYYTKNLDDFTKPEQVMASHILNNVPIGMSAEKKAATYAQMKMIQQKINEGEDFAELAKKYSQDSTAENGGALGYFMRGQMVEAFERAAFSTEKGMVSDIIETEFGYHLIKVLDKTPMIVIPFEDIVDKLKAYLKQQKVQKKVDAYIKQARENAAVEIILT